LPPYELIESAAIPESDLNRIKNFARFWELIVNRRLLDIGPAPVFDRFMLLSDSLLAHFGRNWGIAKDELAGAYSLGSTGSLSKASTPRTRTRERGRAVLFW
jgi:hypothetical protein